MDLPRPPRLIPRSPWNFYQFLSSDVPRSSFLKFPEDPDDSSSLFLHHTFIVFLRDCLPYSSLSSSRSFYSFFISYFPPPFAIVLLPPSASPSLALPLLLPAPCPVSSRIYSSPWSLSILSLFSRVFFFPSPTRWSPTISPSDLFPLRPRRGSRREITLINWSISKAQSSSVRGYLRIYTLREGRKGVPQWGPVYKPYLHRAGPLPQNSECQTTTTYIARSYRWEHSIASRSSNVRVYLPSSILLMPQPGRARTKIDVIIGLAPPQGN